MKLWLGFLLGLILALPAQAAWPEELTPAPGLFPPYRPFHAHYRFGWGMLTAAEADFAFTRGPASLEQLSVTARSLGAVRGLWRMDTRHVSTADAATLRPVSVAQTEAYKDETITTKLTFDATGVTRLREGTSPGSQPGKAKQFQFPQLYDLHSALVFVRSQTLAPGASYRLVVYPATTPYLAQVDVIGRPRLRVGRGQVYNSIRLDLKLWRIGKNLELEAHEKFKKASIWLSDDTNRLLLRVESEISAGSVWGELDHIEWK